MRSKIRDGQEVVTVAHAAPRLGEFLRARRALTRPEQHGIPDGDRRTPGLRRDEVAMLAGVSTDYYTRLEQGRDTHPSPQVVTALADALLLDDEAAAYLRGLAAPAKPRKARPEHAAPGLVALLDAWPHTPALVYGRYFDLLAVNPLGEALFSWLRGERNLLRGIFLEPGARVFYRDWAKIAEGCVAALRAANPDPDDARLAELVGTLSVGSPDFARLWGKHEVRAKTATVKHFHHELAGDLTLRFENLAVTSAPGQHLVVYHAEPGGPAGDALALLAGYALSLADDPPGR
ncbi:helix-turn-helix transcriptional regulator [Amycolatopsis sp. WQ 127309]|uniref:helix-turn-helix transcriptional regulator n=1 Tax=Amycolatopsis sp. WQ 127309 TaxID=2932773 RepID=UPI001FF28D30|nr:helix-turn-helix transcriptional regulator [Amycolatopsis sp. WQ 127309]UOZ04046.1 helix-turn-helix transcriptional regulator [Amycolatopsis sp. WQ 127309]